MTSTMEREMRGCFDYFWNETNINEGSPGYGITRDAAATGCANDDFGSIAATGFALCAYTIGAEKGYVPKADAEKRAFETLQTFTNNVRHFRGFFHHFLHLSTAERWGGSEVSDIDTSIFIAGAITAGEYFGGETAALANALYERIDWNAFVNPSPRQFVMGWRDETGFINDYWDHYAEQLIMCVLGAGSPTYSSGGETLYSFERPQAEYGEHKYIRTRHNALFIHQISHIFIDFRNTEDRMGIDWHDNSVQASLGHWQYCKDNPRGFKTFSEKSWGLSACHYKHGYSGSFGAEPYCESGKALIDGTVALYAALGSMPFTPEQSLAALENYYRYPELVGRYGLVDSYNLHEHPPFFDTVFLGIDKGITLSMMANYENEFIWKCFMKSGYARDGLKAVGIKTRDAK